MKEEALLAKGYRRYVGEDINIYFSKDICKHVGNCTSGDSEVFEVGRIPWIKVLPDHTQKIQEVIKTCPSGALKYKLKGSDEILP